MSGNNAPQVERFVRELPYLGRLPEADLGALARLGRYVSFQDSETVVAEGDTDSSLYLIVEGSVRICVLSPAGDEATIARLGPGRPVGELSLFDGRPRSASAIADGPVRAFLVTREAFLEWLADRPAAAVALLETLSLRVRRTDEALADAYFFELRERLAKHLIRAAAEAGSTRGEVKLRMTQAEVAANLGVTREAVNKQLKRLEREGFLRTGRGSVTISDLDALQSLVV